MSTELQALLVQVEAIEAKDVEVGHVLRALIDYLAKREKLSVQAKSSKGGNHGN